MPIDKSAFAGVPPSASELMGIFQPLVGWRSERGRRRITAASRRLIRALATSMQRDVRVRRDVARHHESVRPDREWIDRLPSWVTQVVASQVEASVQAFRSATGRDPIGGEWGTIIRDLELDATVSTLSKSLSSSGRSSDDETQLVLLHSRHLSADDRRALVEAEVPGTELVVARVSRTSDPRIRAGGTSAITAAVQAGVLDYLAEKQPQALGALFVQPKWLALLMWLDPLASFDPDQHEAVLSPIGLIQIYRQFFFELDTFLGPPVGHVWVSPGGTLELFEVHTRRVIEERTASQQTSREDSVTTDTKVTDELSTQVSEANTTSVSLGVSASGSADLFGVVEVAASTSFGFGSSAARGRQEAHKHARTQSERIATKMRREMKTAFKTRIEEKHVSSRRYVLSNTTDSLVNYEFRRKMRRIGVQLQHVGTRLAWVVYLDEPGSSLGVSELVHIAKRGDLTSQVQPPESPVLLEPQTTEWEFPFEFEGQGDDPEGDVTYIDGYDQEEGPGAADYIDHTKWYTAPSPGPGYTLMSVTHKGYQGTDPERDQPTVFVPDFEIPEGSKGKFKLIAEQVNFQDQPAIRVFVELIWAPPDQSSAEAAYEKELAEYEQQYQRAAHEEYVRAVRERIALAGQVRERNPVDLRMEERTAVLRRLVRQLMYGAGDEAQHIAVEFLRTLFSFEELLYYVAESWWEPRLRHAQQVRSADHTQPLTAADRVGWGGIKARGRPNYLITEESEPAPAGASLGWLIQLDGDSHRNAFLNSPFVKAVIPIRPGREKAALEWLQRADVEGADGLDAPYRGTEAEYQGKTVGEVLNALAAQVRAANDDFGGTLQAERVFETGFDPLEDGFRNDASLYDVFDEWVEIMPTDQVVAVPYDTGEAMPIDPSG